MEGIVVFAASEVGRRKTSSEFYAFNGRNGKQPMSKHTLYSIKPRFSYAARHVNYCSLKNASYAVSLIRCL